MDYVKIAPHLPDSSRLGFGCGSVMGRVGRSESRRAIDAAFDRGVTHFDVARSYGYGDAEGLLGEALRGKRARVVIASKCGLSAPRAATALRGLKPLAQKFAAGVPGLRPLLRSLVGSATGARDRFSPRAVQHSLDRSLAALRTDYLDILLLHDCLAEEVTDELLAHLDAQVAAGKIRAYGCATGVETTAQLAARYDDRLLYQLGNSVCVRGTERVPHAPHRYIAHSPFGGADRLASLLRAGPLRLPSGRVVAAADIHPLMLAYALACDSVAAVLCSMLDDRHLQANLAIVERPPFSPEDIAGFAALALPAAAR